MIRWLTFLFSVFTGHIYAVAQSAIWDDVPLEKVTVIGFPADAVKGKWTTSDGVRIDDLWKSKGQLAGQSAVIEGFKNNGPKGIRSVADFSLTKIGFPLDTVTVRVFVFDEPSQCEAWWREKYEGKDWEKFYEKLDYKEVVAVRSLEAPKIALAFGRVWLTAHHIQSGEEHIQAARYILDRLTKGKKILTENK